MHMDSNVLWFQEGDVKVLFFKFQPLYDIMHQDVKKKPTKNKKKKQKQKQYGVVLPNFLRCSTSGL